MHRPTPAFDPVLERLLDERDDLQIKISISDDTDRPDPEELATLKSRLFDIEKQIKSHRALVNSQAGIQI